MPSKVDNLRVPKEHDKRRKLSDKDRLNIILDSKAGASQRQLARAYNVSRRLIQFILDPSKQEENLKRRKERGGSAVYYSKDKQREAKRRHRKHKEIIRLEDALKTSEDLRRSDRKLLVMWSDRAEKAEKALSDFAEWSKGLVWYLPKERAEALRKRLVFLSEGE